jgi:hypothetical protein
MSLYSNVNENKRDVLSVLLAKLDKARIYACMEKVRSLSQQLR